MTPEERLHLLGPYIPTDRFRAMLRGDELPFVSQGAGLLVDITGFTTLTNGLVTQFGARRAGDELKRRLNPMFEAVAGQVFNHGGSVIRFTGDGFLAWFDDHQTEQTAEARGIPALFRATAAGLEMQAVMRFFKGLKLKVAIGHGTAYRIVVGQPDYGLMDVISGPVIEEMLYVAEGAQSGQVMVAQGSLDLLRANGADLTIADGDRVLVNAFAAELARSARTHRWPAWKISGDADSIVSKASPYMPGELFKQVESGFGNFVGELREAVPMFFSFQTSSATPESMRAVLDESMTFIQSVLNDTGGRLVSVEVNRQQNIVFSTFGAPVTYGDDAERAVSAALALRAWGQQQPGIEAIRIGISRGLLYAGIVGGEVRHEYSTIGDETNLAARMMAVAGPGQILVTPRVRNETRQRVLYRELQPIHVKGREEEINVSEPYGRLSGSHRRPLQGQLIGRVTELNQIQKIMKAVETDMARILRVEGEAGIGKSRLVIEMAEIASARGFRVVTGDCLSTERNRPFLVWRDLFYSLIGLEQAGDYDREQFGSLIAAFLHELNPEWLRRLPLLGDILGRPIEETPVTESLTGHARKLAGFTLLADVLLALARRKPIVIVIEDVHWIDEVSEEFTIELARRLVADPEPILLTLVHRPLNDVDRLELKLVEQISTLYIHFLIVLTDLSRPEVDQLVTSHLKATAPDELLAFVYQKAQGNPFFIKEVLDTLEETGLLRVENNRIAIERDLKESDLPRTVQEIVQTRIDRLKEIDRLILKVAAVIGFSFQVHLLAEAFPLALGYDELLIGLNKLEARQFIHVDETEADLTYSFKHMIIQEVTYQNLLYTQRIDLHRAVGVVLERQAPEAVERLAYHFSQAGDSINTWKYLRAAAEKTRHEFANQAALAYFERMLELASTEQHRALLGVTDEDLFAIRCDRLRIMLRVGSADRAQTELGELARLTERAQRTDWQVITMNFRAYYFTLLNRWADARDGALEAARLAARIPDDALLWDSYMLAGEAYHNLNMRNALQETLPELHRLAERLNDPRKKISLMIQELDDIYSVDPALARTRAAHALVQAERLQDLPLVAACLEALGLIDIRDNDRIAALGSFWRQLDLLRQVGDRRGEGATLVNIGIALVDLGQLSEGNSYLLEGYKVLHQVGAAAGEAHSLVYLGVIAAHRRAYDEALAYALRGLTALRTLNAPLGVSQALLYVGNIYLTKRDTGAAETVLHEARAAFERAGLVTLVAETDSALAEIDLQRGQLIQAQHHTRLIMPLLLHGQLHDMLQPGLSYWRCTQVLERIGRFEDADRVRAAFRRHADQVMRAMPDPAWRVGFTQSIWFHRALLEPIYVEATAHHA